jgi:hypothetical protein
MILSRLSKFDIGPISPICHSYDYQSEVLNSHRSFLPKLGKLNTFMDASMLCGLALLHVHKDKCVCKENILRRCIHVARIVGQRTVRDHSPVVEQLKEKLTFCLRRLTGVEGSDDHTPTPTPTPLWNFQRIYVSLVWTYFIANIFTTGLSTSF